MVSWARGFLLGGRSARVGQPHPVTIGPLLLPVPPSVVDEDLEEAVKVPEGQTAHLTCNATGKGHTYSRAGRRVRGRASGLPAPSPAAPPNPPGDTRHHAAACLHSLCLCPKHSPQLLA